MPGRDVDTALRIVHDLTQSVWLGGALMGVTALDAAASSAPDQSAQVEGVDRAWSRWQRISTPAIAAHLIAGVGLSLANRGRLTVQAGATRTMVARTALTGVAVATELTTRRLGKRIGQHAGGPGAPSGGPDGDEQAIERLQRQLTVAQWANVAAVAGMIGVGSRMGEQQRPRELARGIASRLGLAA